MLGFRTGKWMYVCVYEEERMRASCNLEPETRRDRDGTTNDTIRGQRPCGMMRNTENRI